MVARPTVPSTTGNVVRRMRQSVLDVWSTQGLASVAERVSPACRRETVDAVAIAAPWLPETYVMEWFDAVWEGPAARNKSGYLAFARGIIDHGFGKMQRFFVSFASPEMAAPQLGKLWLQDHSHGVATAEMISTTELKVVLAEHIYTTKPLSRLAWTEFYRYGLTLLRGIEQAQSTHTQEGETVVARVVFTRAP
jgi:hypothetical protein